MSGNVCIAGIIGQCSSNANSLSQTFTNNLTNNLTNNIVSIAQTSGAYISGTQVVDFSGATFNCNPDLSIQQANVSTINFTQLSKTIDSNTLQQTLTSAIQKTVTADPQLTTAFMGNATNTSSQTQTMTTNVNNLANNYTYNQFLSDIQSVQAQQLANFKGITINAVPGTSGTCNFSINQNIAAQILAQSVVNNMLSNASKNASQFNLAETDTASSVGTSKGIGDAISQIIGSIGSAISSPLVMIAVIFMILIIAMAIGVYFFWNRGSTPSQLSQ